jgi:hypothetical protein
MFGGVQLVLGRVEKCCLSVMGGNLEPPPPVQHDAHAHRGSDHDHGRGRPPVRDHGCQDGNAHAGKDRMPLGAWSPLHVVTLTALEHCGLTPRLRFGNRQCVHGLMMEAELASDEFVEDAADPEPIDEEQWSGSAICRRPVDDVSIFCAQLTTGAVPHASKVVAPNIESGRPRLAQTVSGMAAN